MLRLVNDRITSTPSSIVSSNNMNQAVVDEEHNDEKHLQSKLRLNHSNVNSTNSGNNDTKVAAESDSNSNLQPTVIPSADAKTSFLSHRHSHDKQANRNQLSNEGVDQSDKDVPRGSAINAARGTTK